jgi:hypothetical protein
MKEKIVAVLGRDHLITIEFNESVNKVRGLYTFQSDVYVIADGDIPFDELASNEQEKITEMVVNGEWKVNNTLQ